MAHAKYRMRGRCQECERTQFVGVCPHGKAVRVQPGVLTPQEIEEALKKGAKGAKELDKKLDQVFRPLDPREDYYLR